MKNFLKKRKISILLFVGVFSYTILIGLAKINNIPLKNTWYAELTLLLFYGPLLSAGYLYSNKIQSTRPKLSRILRILILLTIITLVAATLSFVLSVGFN